MNVAAVASVVGAVLLICAALGIAVPYTRGQITKQSGELLQQTNEMLAAALTQTRSELAGSEARCNDRMADQDRRHALTIAEQDRRHAHELGVLQGRLDAQSPEWIRQIAVAIKEALA